MASSKNQPKKTFKDIGEGAIFKFAPSSDGFYNDRNLYVKRSSRKYASTDFERYVEHRIGTINAEIIVIREA